MQSKLKHYQCKIDYFIYKKFQLSHMVTAEQAEVGSEKITGRQSKYTTMDNI